MFPYDDPRFAAYLRRLTGAKGLANLTQLLDVMPVVSLAGDRPEDAFIRGERLWMRNQSVSAVAGQYSFVVLELAPDTEVLAVIERIDVSGDVYLSAFPSAVIGGAAPNRFPRDTRQANQLTAQGALKVYGQNNAISGAQPESIIITGRQDVAPAIVLSGARIELQASIVNVPLNVNVWWREVPVPPPNR